MSLLVAKQQASMIAPVSSIPLCRWLSATVTVM
jgi:hypothetical protein